MLEVAVGEAGLDPALAGEHAGHDGGDMAVCPRAFAAEQFGGVPDGVADLEDGTEAINDLRGKRESLASFSLRTRWPSYQSSGSRMTGLLARLGMISMWKDTGRHYGTHCET